MKYIFIFFSVFFIYACNKTYVEDRIPIKTVASLNKSFSMNGEKKDSFTLQIDSSYFNIIIFTKSGVVANDVDSFGIKNGDSAFVADIQSSLPLQQKRSSANKYSLSELIDGTQDYVADSRVTLFAGAKSKPFNTIYKNFASTPTDSINFNPKDNGYLAFQAFDSLNNKIYGWLHVIVDSSAVTFDKYGYQKFESIKAGDENN